MATNEKTIEYMMSDTVGGSQIVEESLEKAGLSTHELISEMKSLKKQIEKQRTVIVSLKRDAMSDPLTDLVNRRVFEKELKRSISVAKRYKRQSALLMVDVNKFKAVNDTYGHVAGDKALVFIAKTLKKHTRHNDVVARIGGDEFCIILNEVSNKADAAERARILTKLISKTPCKIDDNTEINVSVSIGYQIFDGNAEALTIMQHADSSMYSEKELSLNL
jgi:diguanylate cyclase (GGDEF)-like protein